MKTGIVLRVAARALAVCALAASVVRGDSLAALVADRTAVERVYYQHRLGEKPPFEQVSPPRLIERLVQQDQRKEAVLKRVYGMQITPAQVAAEVQRIDATTRAPDVLAQLKGALGNDPDRFARTVVKPILVGRELRQRFENDDQLHAQQRKQADSIRAELLEAKANGQSASNLLAILKTRQAGSLSETSLQLRAAPPEHAPTEDVEVKKRFGPQAQLLSSPATADHRLYFEDLPPDLQRVLRAQLNRPGDISAVIELPGGFLLYVAEEKTAELLSVATLSIPKQSYEQWLARQ